MLERRNAKLLIRRLPYMARIAAILPARSAASTRRHTHKPGNLVNCQTGCHGLARHRHFFTGQAVVTSKRARGDIRMQAALVGVVRRLNDFSLRIQTALPAQTNGGNF
ncbi:hypothetical protein QTH97_30575 [Variovorax sp. J22R24]|uniref:hypothetical protein n=1 Tax=Variovorax gracilis TaxID=3053502 RepID=UPI0025759DA2|nr:hypothetical protein [Variovorax sp. J22R24]MDM0109316.1 hypothetical protein [Variovorax sp. J22R24]